MRPSRVAGQLAELQRYPALARDLARPAVVAWFKHLVIDELWRVKAAISAKSIGSVITSDTVIEQIREELRRQTDHNMDPARHRTQSHHPRARADQAE